MNSEIIRTSIQRTKTSSKSIKLLVITTALIVPTFAQIAKFRKIEPQMNPALQNSFLEASSGTSDCLPPCQTCSNTSKTACLSCQSNHTLYQSQCVECSIIHCKTCQKTNLCSSCSFFYAVDSNKGCIFRTGLIAVSASLVLLIAVIVLIVCVVRQRTDRGISDEYNKQNNLKKFLNLGESIKNGVVGDSSLDGGNVEHRTIDLRNSDLSMI